MQALHHAPCQRLETSLQETTPPNESRLNQGWHCGVQVPGSFMVPVEVVVDTLMSTDFSHKCHKAQMRSHHWGMPQVGFRCFFCILAV